MIASKRVRLAVVIAMFLVIGAVGLYLVATSAVNAYLWRCDIPMDGTRVLLGGPAPGQLREVVFSATGVTTTPIVISTDGSPQSIARCTGEIYAFIDNRFEGTAARGVYHLDLIGGEATQVLTLDRDEAPITVLVSAADALFVNTRDGLVRIDPATFETQVVVSPDDVHLHSGLASDGHSIYFSTRKNEIAKFDAEDAEVMIISGPQSQPVKVEAVVGDHIVFWIGGVDGRRSCLQTSGDAIGSQTSLMPRLPREFGVRFIEIGGIHWAVVNEEAPFRAARFNSLDGKGRCRIRNLMWGDSVILD